jgi:hypothetical protein
MIYKDLTVMNVMEGLFANTTKGGVDARLVLQFAVMIVI